MTDSLRGLIERWEREAATLRARYHDDVRARMLELAAAELSDGLVELGRERLDLAAAVSYSGYSRSHLRALLDAGVLTQAGSKGAPRFFRSELPVKPNRRGASSRIAGGDPRRKRTNARLVLDRGGVASSPAHPNNTQS